MKDTSTALSNRNNETLYWLKLLEKTEYVSEQQYESITTDAIEIIKLLTSSIKTIKQKINH